MNRPDAQKQLPIRLLIIVFVSCFVFYGLVWSGHHYSIDGVVMFQYAKALLFNHSLFMDPPVVWGDFDFVVSKWAIGLTLTYVPILAFLSATFFQGNPQIQEIPYIPGERFNLELLANSPYQYSSFLNPALTAGTAVLLLLLAYRLGFSRKQAYVTAMVFGLISPACVYTKFDFAQPLASFLLLLSFYILILSQYKGFKILPWVGFFLGFAILVRTEFMIMPIPLFLIAAYFLKDKSFDAPSFLRRTQKIAAIGIPIALFVLIHLYLNYVRFGSLLAVGYSPTSEFSFEINQVIIAVIGNLISPGRGILLFCPIALLSIRGFSQALKWDRFIAPFMGVMVVGIVIFYSAWKDWGGGVSWGPRFLIPVVPYFVLLGMWGYYSLDIKSKLVRVSFILMLLFLQSIVSLQGILFNFLDFYSKIQLPSSIISEGMYNFQFRYSPVFAGWNALLHPASYDIFWLQKIAEPSELTIMVVLFSLFVGLFAYTWFGELQESDFKKHKYQ